jgi:cell wall-associated NlpC family hydrolase
MRLLLVLLLALLAGACASTGAVPKPFPTPGGAAAAAPPDAINPPAAPVNVEGYAVAGTALGLRGVRYRNGGADPSGFDCSGFVWYVYAQHGVSMPRTVSEQFRAGAEASGNLQAGDLVFFSTTAPGATHVGIAIGGDEFVHAPSSTGQVRVERLSSSYWSPRYLGGRRMRNP